MTISQAEIARMTAAQLEAERVTLNARRDHFAGLGTRAGRIKAHRIAHRIKHVNRALAERAQGDRNE